MSGTQLLVPDLLSEIMFWLPSDIGQKFAFTQVSRLWRDVALHNPLFWSSFSGSDSKLNCFRVPIILQRSGFSTMLHIGFRFGGYHNGPATDALDALVPYAGRIETLDVELEYSKYSLSRRAVSVEALLNSNLDFPALQTLRLEGSEHGSAPRLLLTAPQLRILDLERFYPTNWDTLLSHTLENIRLYHAGIASVETLFDIFNRCPRAWRVVLHAYPRHVYNSHYTDDDLEALSRRRPFAPALRELELGIANPSLSRILKAGFSNTVLHTLTGRLYGLYIHVLTALLSGVGPLVVFEVFDSWLVELRDEDGRIRRFQCNEASSSAFQGVWEHLSIHYDLHKTVREIRIAQWDHYAYIFELYPPQLHDGITLVVEADAVWNVDFSIPTDGGSAPQQMTEAMLIPGLAKVELYGPRAYLRLKTVMEVLAHVEPPTARKVEVCIGNRKLVAGGIEQGAFGAFQTALSGNCWEICSHCMNHCVH